MAVKVFIPTALRTFANGEDTVEKPRRASRKRGPGGGYGSMCEGA